MAKKKSPKDTADNLNVAPAASGTLSGVGRGKPHLSARSFGMMSITEDGMAALVARLETLNAAGMASFERPKELDLSYSKSNGVALIRINGAISSRSNWLTSWLELPTYEAIEETIEAALNDPEVERIVLDANSPGGSVMGCFGCAEFIAEACETKPIDIHTSTMACSGMYMLAAACNNIYATPGASVASVGVHKIHIDRSEMLKENGYKVTHIVSGSEKYTGHGDSPLSEEDRAALQRDVDTTAEMFISRVAKWRGLETEDITSLNARVVMAEEALTMGLIDGIASLKTVLEKGAEMPKTKPAKADEVQNASAPVAITDSLETVVAAYPVAVKAIQDEAVKVERERQTAITAQTMAGHEELAMTAKAEGWDELRFLRAQTVASKQDGEQHIAALEDAETEVPTSVPSKDMHVAAVELKKNASTEQIKAVFAADKSVRAEFATIETFTASVRLEGYKKEGVK